MKKVGRGIATLIGLSILFLFVSSVDASASVLYRAYNPNTGEHLYTQNASEIPFVVRAGWRDEGTAWEAPSTGADVYRMFNPNNGGDHHYTLNASERDHLKKVGWRYEGVSWKSGGSIPVYRLYNPNAKSGTHHFTTLASEKNHLVKVGWRYEGIAFYSGKDPQPVAKYTVWYNVANSANASHNIKKGTKIFNTEAEATKWIDSYADGLLAQGITSNSYGVSSWEA